MSEPRPRCYLFRCPTCGASRLDNYPFLPLGSGVYCKNKHEGDRSMKRDPLGARWPDREWILVAIMADGRQAAWELCRLLMDVLDILDYPASTTSPVGDLERIRVADPEWMDRSRAAIRLWKTPIEQPEVSDGE